MPEQFHFIHPGWLLALLPLVFLLWQMRQQGERNNPWKKLVDARLLPLLMHDRQAGNHSLPVWLLAGGWLLAVLALADPAWEQQPQPLMQTTASRVIVLDLSRSMLVTDLQPSRLARARFKVEDFLAGAGEGQTGLVVFAGDAFSVTPLTRDADTIRAQLKALEPEIMPSQGSRADLGLLKAGELLQQTGVKNAQVILITDGVEGDMSTQAAARLRKSGHRVSVLGVGTTVGAPLPDGRGGVVEDASGKPLLMKLDSETLQSVARAGGGRYSRLTSNAADINHLLDATGGHAVIRQNNEMQTQKWKDQGPLLAVLLLPLAALAFRRGWLLSVALCAVVYSHPQPAMALGWNDLWLRNDQQAARALVQGEYEQAAQLAKDPALRGSAAYKKQDYEQALDAFTTATGSDAAYNRGNALARLGNYEEAISAYDEALALQPGMADAVANKAAVEAFLKAQQENKQDSEGESDQQDQQADSKDSAEKGGSPEQSPDPADGSNESSDSSENGDPAQPGDNSQASEDQAAGESDSEKQGHDKDNAFSDVNRQLDEREKDTPDETGPDTSTAQPLESNPIEQNPSAESGEQAAAERTPVEAEALSSEEQLAAEQWLRRIADDPGGLLRRKFLYQYRQRQQPPGSTGQDW